MGELGSNYVCYSVDRPRWHKEALAARSWHTGALYKHIISDHRERKYSTQGQQRSHLTMSLLDCDDDDDELRKDTLHLSQLRMDGSS